MRAIHKATNKVSIATKPRVIKPLLLEKVVSCDEHNLHILRPNFCHDLKSDVENRFLAPEKMHACEIVFLRRLLKYVSA